MATKGKKVVGEFEKVMSWLPLPLELKGTVKGEKVRINPSGNTALFAEYIEYMGKGRVYELEAHFYRQLCRNLTSLPPITPDTLLIVGNFTFNEFRRWRCRLDLWGRVATPFNPEIKYDDNGKNLVIEASGLVI